MRQSYMVLMWAALCVRTRKWPRREFRLRTRQLIELSVGMHQATGLEHMCS